jgi:hypothetical protein
MEGWKVGAWSNGVLEYWSSGKIRGLIDLVIRIFMYAEE